MPSPPSTRGSARAPAANRAALRGVLYPLARMRRLSPEARVAYLERAGRSRTPGAPRRWSRRSAARPRSRYYGDANVMRLLGYDADERLGP